jgi:Major Facilitator Superfamily
MFGGVLTSAFNWRAIFWFLAIVSGLNLLFFVLFFRDTFRRERSHIYQNVIKQRRKAAALSSLNDKQPETSLAVDFDLSLADVNPLKPLGQVLRRKNNVIVLIASGNFFFPPVFHMNALTTSCIGLQYSFFNLMAYACSRTLGMAYGYSPMKIGFVILSLGVGKFFFPKTFQTG